MCNLKTGVALLRKVASHFIRAIYIRKNKTRLTKDAYLNGTFRKRGFNVSRMRVAARTCVTVLSVDDIKSLLILKFANPQKTRPSK